MPQYEMIQFWRAQSSDHLGFSVDTQTQALFPFVMMLASYAATLQPLGICFTALHFLVTASPGRHLVHPLHPCTMSHRCLTGSCGCRRRQHGPPKLFDCSESRRICERYYLWFCAYVDSFNLAPCEDFYFFRTAKPDRKHLPRGARCAQECRDSHVAAMGPPNDRQDAVEISLQGRVFDMTWWQWLMIVRLEKLPETAQLRFVSPSSVYLVAFSLADVPML